MYTFSIYTILWQDTQEFSNAVIKNQLLFCSCHLLASLDFWFLHWKIPRKPNLYFPLHPSIFLRLLHFRHHFVSSGIPNYWISRHIGTIHLIFTSSPISTLTGGGWGVEGIRLWEVYNLSIWGTSTLQIFTFTFTFIAFYLPCSIITNIPFCNHYKATGSSF